MDGAALVPDRAATGFSTAPPEHAVARATEPAASRVQVHLITGILPAQNDRTSVSVTSRAPSHGWSGLRDCFGFVFAGVCPGHRAWLMTGSRPARPRRRYGPPMRRDETAGNRCPGCARVAPGGDQPTERDSDRASATCCAAMRARCTARAWVLMAVLYAAVAALPPPPSDARGLPEGAWCAPNGLGPTRCAWPATPGTAPRRRLTTARRAAMRIARRAAGHGGLVRADLAQQLGQFLVDATAEVARCPLAGVLLPNQRRWAMLSVRQCCQAGGESPLPEVPPPHAPARQRPQRDRGTLRQQTPTVAAPSTRQRPAARRQRVRQCQRQERFNKYGSGARTGLCILDTRSSQWSASPRVSPSR